MGPTVRWVAGAWGAFMWIASCGASLPQEAVVRRVIDGDTIELATGQLVRYIGVDTPEVRRKEGDRWVVDPEAMAEAAAELNRRLVEGRRVRIEYDVQTADRFGRLLAYVYVGEDMVNAALIKAGMAHAMTIPPNVRYAGRFRVLFDEARKAGRGLWAE